MKDKLKNEKFNIRNLEPSDMEDLFNWRNNPEVRKHSFNTDAITWGMHEEWFKVKSKEKNTAIYIVYYKNDKIGSIRFEETDNAIKASVMLNPYFIGKGLGSKVIRLGIDRFLSERVPDKPLIAEIKKSNIASIKAFQKAGFEENHITFIFKNEQER